MPALLSAQKHLTRTIGSPLLWLLMLVEAHAASLPWASAPANGTDSAESRTLSAHYDITQGKCEHKGMGGQQADTRTRHATVTTVSGSIAGHSLTDSGRRCIGRVFEYAPDHLTVQWQDTDGQSRYRLTPYHTRQLDNRYCRDYTLETELPDGRLQQIHGRACRLGQAEWRLIGGS